MNRTPLRIISVYALTSYKCLGKAIDTIIVDLPVKAAKANFYTYEALRRDKNLHDFYILRDFKHNRLAMEPKFNLIEKIF